MAHSAKLREQNALHATSVPVDAGISEVQYHTCCCCGGPKPLPINEFSTLMPGPYINLPRSDNSGSGQLPCKL